MRRGSLGSRVSLALSSTVVEGESSSREEDVALSADSEGSEGEDMIPVYKWGIKFGGTHAESVNSFLERVEDLRIARGISVSELFRSAIDLFTDEALTWFRANRSCFTNWKDLGQGLRSEFQPHNYDEVLFEEIKRRTQGKLESVGIYLAKMETLFRRLNTSLSDVIKVTILKRNVLPYYQSHLALVDLKSVEELLKKP